MRNAFARELYDAMTRDERIFLVVADLGYGIFDLIRMDFGRRFINVGAAEQCAVGVGVGLALSGKIPFVYSITPFLLWRAAETIRLYVNHESVPVKLIGSGRGDDYKHDGFSHYAGDDWQLMQCWPNIVTRKHVNISEIPATLREMISTPKPYYLNLRR